MINYTKKRIKIILLFFIGLKITYIPLNIYKTIIFNIHILGIKGLYCWPVYIYYNVNLYKIGKISFNCAIKNGLIKIGELGFESQGKAKFHNDGEIVINGPVEIFGGVVIINSGLIYFEGFNVIGANCLIMISKSLKIGYQTRIGFKSFLMDTDIHYTLNVKSFSTKPATKEIIIGKYNWIGNSTYIKKGTITPDYLIVASSNTQLVKDYSELPPYSVLGGSPAKIIASGIRRIYDIEIEIMLNDFFEKNPDKDSYKFEINDEDLDYFCSNKTF